MVQALAPNRTNHPLDIGSLPGRARGRQHFFDVHVSHPFSEVPAKDAVAVAQQVARDMVKGEGFSQLLTRPLSGWMATHVEVKNAPTIMSQDQKHVEYLETDGGDREENQQRRSARGGSRGKCDRFATAVYGSGPCTC